MRKIVLVDFSQRYGGADVRVGQSATLLGKSFEVTVAVIQGSETHQRFHRIGVNTWPVARGRKDPRLIIDLVRCIRMVGADVVDAHNPQSILWGMLAALICNTPLRISTIHSIFEESEHRHFGTIMFRGLNGLINAAATHVIAVSEIVAQHIEMRGIHEKKIHVVKNGIALKPTSRSNRAPSRIRIGTVGRLVPVKGHTVLLNALSRLATLKWDFECLIIGDGPERQRLVSECARLGLQSSVNFVGFRDDVTQLVSQCDIFCMPSHTEALPFAALEAAALALPIVASNVGGLARHFSDGKTARLVEPNDAAALADALSWCFKNPKHANRLGKQAQEMVIQEYSLDKTLESTRHLYSIKPKLTKNSWKIHPLYAKRT